ncbi:alpha-L-fucosidase [Polaribacter reichenbachii]|uniref:alpha-L-fucosidase n=1 Tax=Polaribacter reichenbachii TaxID=996801 RepID=A0A1B8TVE0_9FLAO|nr:alpha-L-fucosidase [Polaribacter reichenbachii]APZ45505.1 alpha-L-fucosidase [Polaribacter reichenbachii]AUC19366.1 alpha-L-fucosidase [Polaribacter reichenbachii]OBY63479.1 alpha-L-fucosidase [Polaribacter reichenbachii]
MKFLKTTTLILIISLSLFSCKTSKKEAETATKKYTADWESLKQHETPEWFLDAKFGIYCHWGPYSVPEYENEWYAHWMYVNKDNPEAKNGEASRFYKYHTEKYGSLDKFGYKDFIPMFKAEKFDAAEWADLFQKAGAKFAGPVSEHADGFAMWDSDLTKWDAKEMGPKRDVMGELSAEIRKRDMKFIATFHRQWLYGWFPTWDETTDASDPKYAGLYGPKVKKGDFQYPYNPHEIDEGVERYYPLADKAFNDEWLNRLKEIINKYNPDLVWFDNKMDVVSEEHRKEFLEFYYNHAEKNNQEVVSTYKFYDFAKGTAVLDLERSRMKEKQPFPWLTDDSIDWKSWSHISNPRYKSTNRLIDFLVDVVSKNGAVLLNITPRADGTIPEPVKERLLEMGQWLKINGEAIYGTRTFDIYGEGDAAIVEGHLSEEKNADNTSKDIRFTTKGDILYATVLDWPKDGELKIRSLKEGSELYQNEISSIEMLGNKGELEFNRNQQNLVIKLPNKVGNFAYSFKITPKK